MDVDHLHAKGAGPVNWARAAETVVRAIAPRAKKRAFRILIKNPPFGHPNLHHFSEVEAELSMRVSDIKTLIAAFSHVKSCGEPIRQVKKVAPIRYLAVRFGPIAQVVRAHP